MLSPLLGLSHLDIALPSPSWPWFDRTGKERDLSVERVIPPGQTYNSPAPAPRGLQRPRGGAQPVPPAARWAGACAQAPAGLPAGLSGGAPALWAFSAGGSLAGAGRGGAGLRGEVLAGPCLGAEARLLLLLQRSGGGGGESDRARLRRGRWPGQREPQSGSSSGVGGRGRQRKGGPGWTTERTAAPRVALCVPVCKNSPRIGKAEPRALQQGRFPSPLLQAAEH